MPLIFGVDCGTTPCTKHPQQASTIRCCPDCLEYKTNRVQLSHGIAKQGDTYYRLTNPSAQQIIKDFGKYDQIYLATDENSQLILVNDLSDEPLVAGMISLDAQQAEQEIKDLRPVKFAELQTSLVQKIFTENDFSIELAAQQAQDLYKAATDNNSKLAWQSADIYAKLAEDTLKTMPIAQLTLSQREDLLTLQSMRVDTLRALNKQRSSILKMREFHRTFKAIKQ
jgi:hypothetical protein